jgi:RNA polymerase sporulation-specific sigma factor
MENEQLALLIKQGKTEYYTPLWEQTEKLITKIIYKLCAGRELHHTVELEDLLQCGYFALVLAVKYYDPDKKFKFNTYLNRCVQHAINNELRKCTYEVDSYTTSYDKPLTSEDEEYTLKNTFEDKSAAEAFERIELTDTQRVVREALTRLPVQQMDAVKLRYFKDMTYNQIAEQLDTTAENVRSLLSKAMRSLRLDKDIKALNAEYQSHNHARSLYGDPLHYLAGCLYYGGVEVFS